MFGLAIIAHIAFAAQLAATPAPKDGKVIVRLVSRHETISIVSSGSGVRYSAADKTGRVLVSGATLQELKERHPELYRLLSPVVCVQTDETPIPYAAIAAD